MSTPCNSSNNDRSTTVVVLGAMGFLGTHLCRTLLRDGHAVIGVDDLSSSSPMSADLHDHASFSLVTSDVVDESRVREAVNANAAGQVVSGVFNMASPASPIHYVKEPVRTLRTNAEGTRVGLDLARDYGAVFLQASTSEVYGDPQVTPQHEEYWGNVNPIGARSMYDEGKRYAEAMTVAHREQCGTSVRIARIFNSYGPGMSFEDGRLIPSIMKQLLHGDPLRVFGDGTQTRSLCYVSDTIDGLLRLWRSDVTDPVNVGGVDELTVLEISELVATIAGLPFSVMTEALPEDDPRVRRPDIRRAKELLGWTPTVSLDEGIRLTLPYFGLRPSATKSAIESDAAALA